jgi:hypothetical protein
VSRFDLERLFEERFPREEEYSLPDEAPGTPPDLSLVYRPGNREVHECAPPRPTVGPLLSPTEAREMMDERIAEYLAEPDPEEVLLIVGSPGVGKTTRAARAAELVAMNEKHRVLYCGPRHAHYVSVLGVADHPEWWMEWLPRQSGDPETGQVQTCRYAGAITEWMNRGGDGLKFCHAICGYDYTAKACVYHAQTKTKARIVYGQHQHLTLGHPIGKWSLVVIDENPMSAFLREWVIPGQWVYPRGLDVTQPAAELLYDLGQLCEARQPGTEPLSGPALLSALGGAQSVYERAQSEGVIFPVEIPREPGDVERTPYQHATESLPLLAREAKAAMEGREYPHRIYVSPEADGNLTLLLRHRLVSTLPKHLIVADATANEEILYTLLGRPIRRLEPRVPMVSTIYQIHDRANGVSALTTSTPTKKPRATKVKQLADLRTLIAAIVARYPHGSPIGLITHKRIESEFPEFLPYLGHFAAERGTNEFEGVRALIVAGLPQPQLEEIEKAAKMLHFEDMRSFRVERKGRWELPWSVKQVPYQFTDPETGKGLARDSGGFWEDKRLQAVLWQLREAEVIQAAHRARPVIPRDGVLQPDVWLLENLPIADLPPTELWPSKKLFDAPEGANVYKWAALTNYLATVPDGEPVTMQQIAEGAKLSRATVWEHVEKLVASDRRWSFYRVPRGDAGRGRPARAIYRRTILDNAAFSRQDTTEVVATDDSRNEGEK